MQNFSRTLAALDLSKMDLAIFKFLAANASLLGIKKAYLLHIMPDFSNPKNQELAFQKQFAPEHPIDERVKSKLAEEAKEVLGEDADFEFEINVREGKPYDKLLHWVKIKEIGLLIVGKKAFSEGSGITAKRVARNARANILILPTGAEASLKKIIVPLDFSKHSLNALKLALELKGKNPDIDIHATYVVDLPPEDYYSRSKPGTGYRAILMESAKAAYHQFTEKHELNPNNFEMTFLENTTNSIARHLQQFAEEKEASLILMGAKGHSPFENFLFGSVTEKLVDAPFTVPILVVRG